MFKQGILLCVLSVALCAHYCIHHWFMVHCSKWFVVKLYLICCDVSINLFTCVQENVPKCTYNQWHTTDVQYSMIVLCRTNNSFHWMNAMLLVYLFKVEIIYYIIRYHFHLQFNCRLLLLKVQFPVNDEILCLPTDSI